MQISFLFSPAVLGGTDFGTKKIMVNRAGAVVHLSVHLNAYYTLPLCRRIMCTVIWGFESRIRVRKLETLLDIF